MSRTGLKPLFFVVFSFLMSGCAGCGSGDVGAPCHPDDARPCADGLVCVADRDGQNVCLIPAGATCNPSKELQCQTGAECFEQEDGSGVCLVTRGGSCDMADSYCAEGLVCAETNTDSRCFNDVVLRGVVFDSDDLDAIPGAHVIGFNEEGSAVTDIAVSDADGVYELSLPARRDSDGKPLRQFFTLRASAQDYQTFPSGIRTALPIDASTAASDDTDRWIIDTAQTDIALIILPAGQRGNPSISGRIHSSDRVDGVLVVAEADGRGVSAVSDLGGDYTIFNVPSGDYTVKGYAAHVQLDPVSTRVTSEDLIDVDLFDSDDGIADVAGQVQIVAAHGSLRTSVVFMVASTFDEVSVRGEVPVGLRAPRFGTPDINGEWRIEGVPAGEYVVLAGFENDELVRDPDENIAGTAIVRLTVPAQSGTVSPPDSFKVTSALTTVSPGRDAPEAVTSAPMLEWGIESNAEHYSVLVFNAYGDVVWQDDNVARVTGASSVRRQYEGPLEDGMYYQFRATAWRRGSPVTTTEVLRGVFYKE